MIFKTSIFEIPFYRTRVTKQKEIKDYFCSEILEKLKGKNPNNHQLNLYSDYFKQSAEVCLDKEKIIYLYAPEIQKFRDKAGFSKTVNWDVDIDLWYNVGVRGTQQEEHDHLGGLPSTSYSAIHYVIFDPTEHQSTVFFNPIHTLYLRNMHVTKNSVNQPDDWNSRISLPDVTEGDMVIFPSYLRHCVPYQESNKVRVTVALNFTISEKTDE